MQTKLNSYNYLPTNITDKVKKKKLMIATVYDFLKRNYLMSVFVECFKASNPTLSYNTNGNVLKYCISTGVSRVLDGKDIFRNFFYSSNLTFNWDVKNLQYRELWASVDRIWINVVDKLNLK